MLCRLSRISTVSATARLDGQHEGTVVPCIKAGPGPVVQVEDTLNDGDKKWNERPKEGQVEQPQEVALCVELVRTEPTT